LSRALLRVCTAVLLLGLLPGFGGAWSQTAPVVDPANAPDGWVSAARALPVLAEGRVMPLETWARIVVFRLTGKDNDPSATRWLLSRLAGFEVAASAPALVVNDPAVLIAAGLKGDGRRLYSALELQALLSTEAAAALELQYTNDTTPLGKEGIRLAKALQTWLTVTDPTQPRLRLFRLKADAVTPFQLAQSARTDGESTNLGLFVYWQKVSRDGNWSEAEATMELLSQRSSDELGIGNPIQLELLHNAVPWSLLLLLLAISGFGPSFVLRGRFFAAQKVLITAAFAVMSLWLVVRMLLTGRPPVTNLPSTFLFVGWLGLLLSLVVAWGAGKGQVPKLATWALVLGAVLPTFSSLFEGAGDPFPPLQAVLNTNFWLAIHVTMITGGYAAILLSALVGHAYLWRSTAKGPGNLLPLWKALSASLVWGLSLTFVGTLLGGFWADQSWGRFWGWDPKENGALLILLWTALVLHLRPAGWAQEWGTALAAALGLPVLLFSWMGVNLLGQGFHSYGSATGRSTLFFGLLAVEALTLGFLLVRKVLR
jgi:ABC-type transport system involved in cytochrome c biogenesis permease subunit